MNIKKIWYHMVKIYIGAGLYFFYKEIQIYGTKNIPKKGALLFVSNHKNALIDPLLIATTTTRNIHFLTRASAFKIKIVKWILSTVNMLPIYRLRDGKETLAKNNEIFSKCYGILNAKRSLLIFPESTHDIRRWVRPLSKGFTRITFGALEQNENLQLSIVPVGLNYSKAEDYASSVSIYYGTPIDVNQFYDVENINASTQQLKKVVSDAMKSITTHVDDIDNYESVIKKLGNVDYLKPEEVNEKIKKLDFESTQDTVLTPTKPSFLWNLFYKLMLVNSGVSWLIWKAFKPKIKEVEFISTTKFAIGISAFPLFYFIQALLINYFFGGYVGLLYFVFSVLLVLVLTKTKNAN